MVNVWQRDLKVQNGLDKENLDWKAVRLIFFLLFMPSATLAANCDALSKQFGAYDVAMSVLERTSRSETSTLRATTAQGAVTNILLRQNMILDMMIAQSCVLPEPPMFPLLGLISSKN